MEGSVLVIALAAWGGIVASVAGARLFAHRSGRRKRLILELFQSVARSTGLGYSPPDLFGNGAGLTGHLDGLSVTVEAAPDNEVLVVDVHGGVPEALTVLRRSVEDEQTIRREDRISVGDPDLGTRATIAGDEAVVLACLSHSVRRVLDAMIEASAIGIEHGHLIRRIPAGDPARVEAMLTGAVALAKRIGEMRPPDGLAANVASDPLPDVRARNLEVLLVRFADDPATARAVHAALQDTDARIRLTAELWSEPTCTAALASRTAGQLADSLLALEPRIQEALLRRIAARGSAAEELLLLLSHRYAENTSRFPLLFGTSANTLARAALEGLGAIGTVRSVEPLLALARGGLLADPAVVSKANEAIAHIQSRLTGAGAGQLAISEAPGEGALSVTGAGALSEADPEKSRR